MSYRIFTWPFLAHRWPKLEDITCSLKFSVFVFNPFYRRCSSIIHCRGKPHCCFEAIAGFFKYPRAKEILSPINLISISVQLIVWFPLKRVRENSKQMCATWGDNNFINGVFKAPITFNKYYYRETEDFQMPHNRRTSQVCYFFRSVFSFILLPWKNQLVGRIQGRILHVSGWKICALIRPLTFKMPKRSTLWKHKMR